MITIYGSPKSSSGRCFWCLEEVEVDYEVKSINFKEKEHKSEAYLKINPNGKVPTLTDGDYTIWESMAINFYLAEAYKPELLGNDAKEKGLVYQWSIWAIADLQVPIIDVFIQLMFVPKERQNQELIEKSKSKIPDLLQSLERGLEKQSYLLGENFTLADLNVASVITICHAIRYDLSSYQNINQWLGNIAERTSYKKYMELM